MRLLLDTHVFLWMITDDPRLNQLARDDMADAEVYVSAASIWEIAIKSRLGKIEGDVDLLVDAIEESGLIELPVRAEHAVQVAQLPLLHHDPFDRLLVAQAMTEPLVLLTADKALSGYSELVRVI